MSNQDQLTEDLWFLSKLYDFYYRDLDYYVPVDDSHLKILDAVAIYLTTGRSDCVIACYYQDSPPTLILAKGGCVNPEDRSAVTMLLKELTAAKDWLDLIPFLAKRSPDKVNRRIRKLRTTFTAEFDCLCEAAKEYRTDPDSSMPEFRGRWSRSFLRQNGLSQTVPAEIPQTLIQVLTLCKNYLTGNQDFENTRTAWIDFIDFLYAAKTLLDSQFFDTHGHPILKRHLAKVTQYIDIHYAVKFLQRLGGEIGVQWITDVGPVTRMVDTTEVGKRFKKTFVDNSNLRNDRKDFMLSNMDINFPGWRGGKDGPTQVTLFVHPEIRLFLELVRCNTAQSCDIIIGCSQKRCFACKAWIKKLCSVTDMKLITDVQLGKLRLDWAYPDITVLKSDTHQLRADPNLEVKKAVEDRIAGILGQERWRAFNL